MLVSSWLLFTKLKKLRFRKNEHFRTVSNVRKQKNAQNWRLRFRFRRRQAMALYLQRSVWFPVTLSKNEVSSSLTYYELQNNCRTIFS